MSRSALAFRRLGAAALAAAVALSSLAALVACGDPAPACAAPPAPRPAAPAYRPPAPSAPRYQAPRVPVSKPTVYRTTYDHGVPVIVPVPIVVDGHDYDCD